MSRFFYKLFVLVILIIISIEHGFSQQNNSDSTIKSWQVPDKLKPLRHRTWFSHFGYSYLGKNVPFVGITFSQEYSTSTGYPEYSKRIYGFALDIDLGVGLFINEQSSAISNHVNINFTWIPNTYRYLFVPSFGFQSLVLWDKVNSQTYFPEIGFSLKSLIDVKYGYPVFQTNTFKSFPKHYVIITFRPGILLNAFNKNP